MKTDFQGLDLMGYQQQLGGQHHAPVDQKPPGQMKVELISAKRPYIVAHRRLSSCMASWYHLGGRKQHSVLVMVLNEKQILYVMSYCQGRPRSVEAASREKRERVKAAKRLRGEAKRRSEAAERNVESEEKQSETRNAKQSQHNEAKRSEA